MMRLASQRRHIRAGISRSLSEKAAPVAKVRFAASAAFDVAGNTDHIVIVVKA
jgi:hypothetical protein